MRRFLTMFVVLLLSGVLAHAQTRTISGQVRDAQGAPIQFATVTEPGTRNNAVADAAGNFTIKVKQSTTSLTYSASGYDAQTVNVSGNTASAELVRNSSSELSAVVVTALGQTRQSKEIGYSTAKIKSAELTQAKTVNLQNGLTGKVSGLNVQTVNNGVFADTRITLRGIRSLTGNNQPMLVLDGVPISLSYISSINPNDILDVNILKSSSSTAIYGPDGVNGAIIITTKKGNKGKPTLTVSHTVQLEQVSFLPKFQYKFGSGSSEDGLGQGVYDPIENQQYGDAFDGSLREIGRKGPDGKFQMVPYSALGNEKYNFWATGVTNQTDVSYAAGDFYLSAQNVDIKGTTPKDKNKRIALHMSANKEYNRFKAAYSVNYTQSNYNVNAGNFWGGRDYTPYWNLINTPPQVPVTQYKDWKNDYYSSPNGYYNDYYFNPYFMVDNFRQNGRTDDVFGNVELNYKVASWLNLTYRVGNTYSNTTDKFTQGAYTYSAFAKASGKSSAQSGDLVAKVYDDAISTSRFTSEVFATAHKDYKKFKFDLLAGQSYRQTTTKSLNVSSDNLGIPEVFNSAVRKGDLSGGEANSRTRLERFYGRFSVGFNNWAYAEVTGSNDIDSRLSNPYNYNVKDISFFYPGASVSFVLSDAIPSLKSDFLSFLKVRGAISKTGNVNLGAYSLQNTFSAASGFPFGSTLGFTSDNTLRQSSYKPEFVKNKEVGLEVSFMKNRINFEATAYKQDNSNQIITVAYSAATGYPNALLNAADFTNKGLELDLKLTPLVKIGKFNVDFKANYTYQENKVNKLLDGVDELGIGNGNYIIKGAPAYTFKLTDYVRDSLGRVIVSSKTGLPTQNNVVTRFGQTLPKHLLGLSLNVGYKGLNLSAVADYRTGNQIYSGIGPDMDFSGQSYRSAGNNRQPFVFPNSSYDDGSGKYVANTSVYTTGGYNFWSQSINTAVNSNYISSGAFWKLRELALSYALPASIFTGKGLKGMTVSITGRNLVTWLPKSNEWTDPEFSNTTGNAQGVNDRNNTPPTRIFGANVTLQF
jgi:TonB-linked SusC/RagA family outer membrane protein